VALRKGEAPATDNAVSRGQRAFKPAQPSSLQSESDQTATCRPISSIRVGERRPKDRAGQGHWLKGQTEHLVIAVRGRPIVTLSDQTTLLRGPFHLVSKGAHAKPIEAYGLFESLVPAPRYADLFSRYRHNDKWDCHGDEAPDNDAAAPNQHFSARPKRKPAPEGER
jgi:MT-A70